MDGYSIENEDGEEDDFFSSDDGFGADEDDEDLFQIDDDEF